jgi:Methane oxygenase PmoA
MTFGFVDRLKNLRVAVWKMGYLSGAIGLWIISTVPAVAAAEGVVIQEKEGYLRIEVNSQLFTEYHYQGAPHLYFHPLIGPGGLPMTRDFPMKNSPGEEQDHKHHRSLWYGHGDVNGVDFWSEEKGAGSIRHVKFLDIQSGKFAGWIRSSNEWVNIEGGVVCTDERIFRVYTRPDQERVFDFEISIFAQKKDLVLGDTKEGSMAIRLNESLRLKPNSFNASKPAGTIVQDTGAKNDETWGKRAAWCDYQGWLQGKQVGVAFFDHPHNPRHPTHWHVRDYGLFAANPFGLHDFENKPKGAGKLIIPPGRSITFRYRFYIHEGDTEAAKVSERYKEYSTTNPVQF